MQYRIFRYVASSISMCLLGLTAVAEDPLAKETFDEGIGQPGNEIRINETGQSQGSLWNWDEGIDGELGFAGVATGKAGTPFVVRGEILLNKGEAGRGDHVAALTVDRAGEAARGWYAGLIIRRKVYIPEELSELHFTADILAPAGICYSIRLQLAGKNQIRASSRMYQGTGEWQAVGGQLSSFASAGDFISNLKPGSYVEVDMVIATESPHSYPNGETRLIINNLLISNP